MVVDAVVDSACDVVVEVVIDVVVDVFVDVVVVDVAAFLESDFKLLIRISNFFFSSFKSLDKISFTAGDVVTFN